AGYFFFAKNTSISAAVFFLLQNNKSKGGIRKLNNSHTANTCSFTNCVHLHKPIHTLKLIAHKTPRTIDNFLSKVLPPRTATTTATRILNHLHYQQRCHYHSSTSTSTYHYHNTRANIHETKPDQNKANGTSTGDSV
ncbi:hypothetical protein DOY81_006240, partial [Sarcophaga bullata]